MSQKIEVIESKYETLVYLHLSSREPTKRVYEIGALRVDTALQSKHALQVQVQWRRIERATEQLGNKKGFCVAPASFCTCEFIKNFWYAKSDEKDSQHKKDRLASPSLSSAEY